MSSKHILLEMEVLLASSEKIKLSRKNEKDAQLFSAFGVSVGRLGVIVSVTVPVERNSNVERHVRVFSAEELLNELNGISKSYIENNFTISPSMLDRFDETQMLWWPTR